MSEAPSRPRVRRFRAEREFGLLVGAILVALGAWWLYREKLPSLRLGFLVVGALLVLLGGLYPRALALPYRAWMALAEGLSRVVTTIILGVVFFLVVTPIGLFKRLRGWDPLERRRAVAAAAGTGSGGAGTTFWRPYGVRQHDPKHFDRMF
jgi:hypothetical protein